ATAQVAAAVSAPHCGRFAKFLVPTPPGFGVMGCVDSNGMAALTFSGPGSPSAACVPMKQWVSGLGWTVDAESDGGGAETMFLHHEKDQLTVACTAAGGMTMVSVALMPRS